MIKTWKQLGLKILIWLEWKLELSSEYFDRVLPTHVVKTEIERRMLFSPQPIFYRQSTVLIIRYDTRCYFNMLSKADISQLNLLHVTNNWKWKKEWRRAQKYRRQTDEMATGWLVWDWWDGYLMTGVRLMRWLPDDWCETDEMATWWLVW